ncbi:MAG: hypothetical protein H5U02_00540 [Clostridia bacterium]|nr:hypothetical protein [Clostridia bacterium]
MDWKVKLKSRKFWMALVSAVLLVANEGLGLNLPEDVIVPFAALVISYILGEAIVDAAAAKKRGEE